ncbi:restriction endonuclease subunit S [Enterocloster clostridioformis]|uniref:Restriction modification system DNA specificity subunit n=2 Tax=Enterocloster clostridioformis TaxID=1531 RepID=A0A174SVR6_9FIRM|nr:restriction endonuclease subunit S [Enterocloster clostridioformis]MCI7357343.1 restriction endonuclease subunit S [Parabacteroides sp.]CUQ01692.1 restriction modification system DNA specificity subunit [Enterocloster clostridioformis]CUX75802.1 EcoKI restriction-modification system protein HsdS [Clostridium sp. C105KSO14]
MVAGNLARKMNTAPEPEVHISESPIKWCSVSLSDMISRGKRLEASVFDVEAKQARESVYKGKYGTVILYGDNGLIETAYYPGWMQRSRLKRIWCDKPYGEGFYLPSQMTDLYPVPEKHISRLADCDMDELRLKENTLLLTRSGTIGNISYVSKTLAGCVFSDDVIRVAFKKEYDLGYVYTYLKSKVGSLILQTNGYGSVITHVEPDHLAEIPVPNAPVGLRQHIHNLIARSYALRDESNGMIDKATSLMTAELHLPAIHDFQKIAAPVSTFDVKLSNMNLRLDASYHVPVADAIVTHLKENAAEVTKVGDSRISKAVILPGRFARVYVDEGYGRVLIGGKQLGELDPSGKKYISNTKHDKILSKLEVHENTTLITRSGTIGKIAFVPKHWEHWIPSDHIIRVVPANEDVAGYLYIFLTSDYGRTLITRYTYGSVVDEIDDNHVRQIAIPLLKDHASQKRINDLALEANQKRYEAYCLEQEALRLMNEKVIFAK